jgi:hypothetical protein
LKGISQNCADVSETLATDNPRISCCNMKLMDMQTDHLIDIAGKSDLVKRRAIKSKLRICIGIQSKKGVQNRVQFINFSGPTQSLCSTMDHRKELEIRHRDEDPVKNFEPSSQRTKS